ncbi:unnamed protein product [Fusarium venenatum]|uniref:RelA/SpoT domain-containing protein n=1 Tax=Fusarium venenatum TaxID=56646 RepID=A0A2L2TBW5_9HYPO|nr:uncharacterized protein FVRRES_04080 [Fusarium venenatum]CEI67568.1 unnamed protein product [Fusarium venenatum]
MRIELDNAKIRATISSRVKSNSSIEKSIQRRQTAQGQSYHDLDEIFKGIHDLAGLRIVVDFPPGIQAAQELVQRLEVVGKSEIASDRDLSLEWKPRFGSFESMNYRVKIHPTPDHALYIYRDVLIEIQVLSLAESLYNKLAHPLVYKKTSREQLSIKDQKLIDVSHGLSLCYWICLSSMQDQLEGPEMPEAVRKIGAGGDDVEIEHGMAEVVHATPRMPTSEGTISTTALLDFIRESQTKQSKSFEELLGNLLQLAKHAAPTTVNNFSSGHTSNNFGNISNSWNPSSSSAYVKALFITDPRVDKDEIQDEKVGLLKESSDWILEHDDFKDWDRGDTSSLLWINGEPGKGKTMLMCRIVDELSSRTNLSYFFCKANEPNANNVTSVLRGLMYLLIQQDDVAMSCFERECQRYGTQYFENKSFTLSQLRRILQPVLAALSPRHVYLAVDALDECVEGQRLLLEIISDNSQSQHVRWIVSSRNKPLITEHLERPSTCISLEQNEISVSAAVVEYIKHKTTALFELKRYEEKMMQSVMNILSSKAQSTFLWVSLACQMLADRESFDPVGVLDDFPSGLDSLYSMMLKEIRSTRSCDLYQQIINVVLTVLRPVSLHELQLLAPLFPKGLRDDKMTEVIRYCGCFLSVRDSFVHFVHESAKDFLLNPNYGFDYVAEQQHYEILMSSLTVMSTLHLTNDFKSVKYPCTQWAFHISHCNLEAQTRELKDEGHIDAFLRKSYLEWFKALGYLHAVSDGILCMLELSRRISGQVSTFARLIQEETSFMRYHKVGIERSPNVIYGALVFSPSSSIVRKVYGEKEPKWITMKPNVDDVPTPMHSLEGHGTYEVVDISFSYDGRLLASASSDQTIRVWDVATGVSIHILEGHHAVAWSVAFCGSNYQLASASEEIVIIWDGENGANMNSIHNSVGAVVSPSVALSKRGDLVCGSAKDGFKLWNSETGTLIRTFPQRFDEPKGNSVAISGCGKFLAGAHARILLWNLESGELLYKSRPCQEFMIFSPSLKFSAENKLWVFGNSQFFLLDPGKKKIILKGRTRKRGPDNDYYIPPDSTLDWVQNHDRFLNLNLLAIVSGAGIEIWDLNVPMSTSISAQARDPSKLHRVYFFPSGNFIVSNPDYRSFAIWRFKTKKITKKIYHEWTPSSRSPVLATDGNIIAYIEKGRLMIRDMSTGLRYCQLEEKLSKRGHGKFTLGTISSDGRWIALGTRKHIHVYDIKKKEYCQHLKNSRGAKNTAVAFSHSSRQLAVSFTVGFTNFINILDTNSWTIRVLDIPIEWMFNEYDSVSLLFSRDDSSLMFSYDEGLTLNRTEIYIWKLIGAHDPLKLRLDSSCKFRYFDSETSVFTTNVGVFKFTQTGAHSKGYAISPNMQWVLWRNKPVLWLPPEFRPREEPGGYEVHEGHKLIIGLASDRVLFLGFDPIGPPADSGQPSFLVEPWGHFTRSSRVSSPANSETDND